MRHKSNLKHKLTVLRRSLLQAITQRYHLSSVIYILISELSYLTKVFFVSNNDKTHVNCCERDGCTRQTRLSLLQCSCLSERSYSKRVAL